MIYLDSEEQNKFSIWDNKWTLLAFVIVLVFTLYMHSYWIPNQNADYDLESIKYDQKVLEMETEYVNITETYGEYSFEAVTYKELMDEELRGNPVRFTGITTVSLFICGIVLTLQINHMEANYNGKPSWANKRLNIYFDDDDDWDDDDEFGFDDDDEEYEPLLSDNEYESLAMNEEFQDQNGELVEP